MKLHLRDGTDATRALCYERRDPVFAASLDAVTCTKCLLRLRRVDEPDRIGAAIVALAEVNRPFALELLAHRPWSDEPETVRDRLGEAHLRAARDAETLRRIVLKLPDATKKRARA